MREWLCRSELNALLTHQLRQVGGCAGCTIEVGCLIPRTDAGQCNWGVDFQVTTPPGSLDERRVRIIAGRCLSAARGRYNLIDDTVH
jgi:hypothetical protein